MDYVYFELEKIKKGTIMPGDSKKDFRMAYTHNNFKPLNDIGCDTEDDLWLIDEDVWVENDRKYLPVFSSYTYQEEKFGTEWALSEGMGTDEDHNAPYLFEAFEKFSNGKTFISVLTKWSFSGSWDRWDEYDYECIFEEIVT